VTEKKRRLLIQPTVRERAQEAQNKTVRQLRADQPKKRPIRQFLVHTARVIGWPLRPFRKVGRIIGLVLVPRYFRNSWKELRKVKWPTRKETAKLTLAVFTFAIVLAMIVTVTDYGLDKLLRKVILK
jgi:preprotein translocase subunit SecE